MKRFANSRITSWVLMFLAIVAGFVIFAHAPALAQSPQEGLDAVNQVTQLSSADPRVIAVRIINVVLGVLGILMVSLMLYAGFLWMTSGGDTEKVDKAKRIIRNAIIGVVIILSSWAITSYIIKALLDSVDNGGGVSEYGDGGSGGGFGGIGSASTFQVRSISPSGNVMIRNVEVRFVFTQPVDTVTVASGIQVLQSGSPVAGRITVDGSVATFIPEASCPAPNAQRHCFDANTDFRAIVKTTLKDQMGQRIACTALSSACEQTFRTGALVDAQAPTVNLLDPMDGASVPVDVLVSAVADARDDTGIGLLELLMDGARVDTYSSPTNASEVTGARLSFDTHGLSLKSVHRISVKAHDIDSNNVTSRDARVIVRAGHCFDETQNAGESGIDCGGSDCGACAGGSCATGTDCAGGVCNPANVCVEQPLITGMSPQDGKAGTFVTIFGRNLGRTRGTVAFSDAKIAQAPMQCSSGRTWTNSEVLVAVPEGAVSGPVTITNATSRLSDTSNDAQGPNIGVFTVNAQERPGLCLVDPSHGVAGTSLTLTGVALGTSSGSSLLFTDRKVTTLTAWTDSAIVLPTPTWSPAGYAVSVSSSGAISNAVLYRIDEPIVSATPEITSIVPSEGPVGEYITVYGKNLGDRVGSVFVSKGGEVGLADLAFPQACGTGFWKNDLIVFKVPRSIGSLGNTPVTPGEYQISIQRPGAGQPKSNALAFTVNTNEPSPGICSLEPTGGPVSTEVTVNGERFGSGGVLRFKTATGASVPAEINAGAWTDTRVIGRVPTTAVTGLVDILRGTRASNGNYFTVKNCHDDALMCRGGRICCASGSCSDDRGICPAVDVNAHYAWQISTGIIPVNPSVVESCDGGVSSVPSPAPWGKRTEGQKACVNSAITVRFNTRIDPSTISTNTVLVQKCTGTGSDPCATVTSVAPRVTGSVSYPLLTHMNDTEDYVSFVPNTPFESNTTYRVLLKTGIRTPANPRSVPMLAKTSCGPDIGYCFTFKTSDSATPCKADSVSVMPSTYTAKTLEEKIAYQALPRSSADMCTMLDASMPWNWHTGDSKPDGRASISTVQDGVRGWQLPNQTGTPLFETGDVPVPVHADLQQDGTGVIQGVGNLFIKQVQPMVVAHGPDCASACTNSAVWARFNVPMDPSSFTMNTVEILRCDTENCRSGQAVNGVRYEIASSGAGSTSPNTFLRVDSAHSYLEVGRYYRVTLKGSYRAFGENHVGVRGANGLPLSGVNSNNGFTWTFRVKPDVATAECAVGTVTVVPVEKYETLVGARTLMTAIPTGSPDECSATGQILISANRNYSWSVADTNVARLYPNASTGGLDTTPSLPPRCSGACVQLGSDGPDGKTARCGDGVVETTDANTCTAPVACSPADADPACVKRGTGFRCVTGDTDCVTRRAKQSPSASNGNGCIVLPAGSTGGEECDFGSSNGETGVCSRSCVWNPKPSILSTSNPGTCGNGRVDVGEQCDPGRHCSQGSSLGVECRSDSDCGKEGVCGVLSANGCSGMCQAEGATSGKSTCGDGVISDGETCDDGNTTSNDGCSNLCVHEGSSQVTSLCGNGIYESGEQCERTNTTWPKPGCNPSSCLLTGTVLCKFQGQANCCGNGVQDPGEALGCDPYVGAHVPGCTNQCLKAGSSISYIEPSFCGDGVVGIGEECEAPRGSGGDGYVDNRQLAEIVGRGTTDAEARMSTAISAQTSGKSGSMTYGLQCGFSSEDQCGEGNGLTDIGCCAPRPVMTSQYPRPTTEDVCRNVEISGEFSTDMDEVSLQNNMIVAEAVYGTEVCPDGGSVVGKLGMETPRTLWGRIVLAVHHLVGWMSGDRAYASESFGVLCASATPGSVNVSRHGTVATYALTNALKPDTEYRVIFRGNPEIASSIAEHRKAKSHAGIRSKLGVEVPVDDFESMKQQGSYSWTFRTGKTICMLDAVTVDDTTQDHTPFFFGSPNESHPFTATAEATHNGQRVPLVSVKEYDWSWQPWISSEETIARISNSSRDLADVSSLTKNGNAMITASVKVERDSVSTPSTENAVINGSHVVNVLLCEHPWPALDSHPPFSDETYHVSTLYCRDAQTLASSGDNTASSVQTLLPALSYTQVPVNEADRVRGIERQYIFTYQDSAFKKDGIGLRIFANPLHLSPLAWYRSLGFSGQPSAISLDGYQAIKDGSTVYVAGTNIQQAPRTITEVSSTMFVLSMNADALPETVNIFQQLLTNWTFNTNIQNASNVCVNDNDTGPVLDNGAPIRCTADWECSRARPIGTRIHCDSMKAKLQRNERRIADFQDMIVGIEQAKATTRSYPMLSSGSFVQTMANSRWPSWQSELSKAIGKSLPQDPINRFMSCGVCQRNGTNLGACVTDADCGQDARCIPRNGFDPATCWNPSATPAPAFQCPATETPYAQSYVYSYRAIDGGARYELATQLEGVNFANYKPALVTEIKRCTKTGTICSDIVPCPTVPGGQSCVGTGGRWKYANICSEDGSASSFGSSTTCGDGVIGSAEVCEVGDTHPASCSVNGVSGTKYQICSDCRAWIDGPSTTCIQNNLCGNGRVDKYKCTGSGYKQGQTCTTDADCRDARDGASPPVMRCEGTGGELCDDGALNGTYGHCNIMCDGYAGVCGDGAISGGEACDVGLNNGAYCGVGCNVAQSCASDCRGPAPYCGDGRVTDAEQCERGQTERSSVGCTGTIDLCAGVGNICSGSKRGCTQDADCASNGGSCVARNTLACDMASSDANQCGTDGQGSCVRRATEKVRSCGVSCGWSDWSACQAVGSCGNGVKDSGEECDDGNASNNDGCTNQCKTNVCGDGALNPGVEECDLGSQNGVPQKADYMSTVISCSKECRQVASSGGFCGNNVRDGGEVCDGTATIDPSITCVSQGYDFAKNVRCAHSSYSVATSDPARVVCPNNEVTINGGCCCASNGKLGYWTLTSGGDQNTAGNFVCKNYSAPDSRSNIACVVHPASMSAPEVIPSEAKPSCTGPVTEVLSCATNICAISGCGACDQEPGEGVIEAQVFDALYSNQPVPNARVTLTLRGKKIAETYADINGRFKFERLNKRPECASYRIVVDFYGDNVCTDASSSQRAPTNRPATGPNACNGASAMEKVDESVNGGYWSFESPTFTLNTFTDAINSNENPPRIYLLPRVAQDETLVVHLWKGALDGRYILSHLILPPSRAYTYNFAPDVTGNRWSTLPACTQVAKNGGSPSGMPAWTFCLRDIREQLGGQGPQGNPDLSQPPYARLFCQSGNGQGCFQINTSPQATKYKLRGSTSLPDELFRYFLVDQRKTVGDSKTSAELYSQTKSIVYIVTANRVYQVTPPASISSHCSGKYWEVFTQNALTGVVDVHRDAESAYQCSAGTEPNSGRTIDDDSAYLLPPSLNTQDDMWKYWLNYGSWFTESSYPSGLDWGTYR